MGPSQAPLWIEGLPFRESKAGSRGCLLVQAAWALPSHHHSAHLCQCLCSGCQCSGCQCPTTFCSLLGVALPGNTLGSSL